MRAVTCILALLALAASARAATADPEPGFPGTRAGAPLDTLAVGTLMRISSPEDSRTIVWTRHPMFRATLLRASADSLWVTPVGKDRVLEMAREGVVVEVRAGRSHFNGIWAGAALGLLTGLAAGTVGAIVYRAESDDEMADLAFLVFPLLTSVYTVPIGAVIGGVSGVDRWTRVN